MTVRAGRAVAVVFSYEAAAVVKIVRQPAVLGHIFIAAVVEVVPCKVHVPVQKGERAVKTAHPRGRDAVSAAPAALAAAHSASATPHIAHHRAGKVVEPPVVGVVAVEDEADLTLVREASHHGRALIAPVVHVIVGARHVMSAAGHYVAEPSLHHSRLDGEVDDGLLVAVVDAREHRLVGFLLHDLHFLDYLRGNVLRRERRVVEEERLAVDGYLRDCLPVGGYRTVLRNLDPRKLLEKFLKHVVVRGLERRGVVLDGILLHDNRISHGRYLRGLKHLYVRRHLHVTQIDALLHDNVFLKALVAHYLRPEVILPPRDLGDGSSPLRICKHVMLRFLRSLDSQ